MDKNSYEIRFCELISASLVCRLWRHKRRPLFLKAPAGTFSPHGDSYTYEPSRRQARQTSAAKGLSSLTPAGLISTQKGAVKKYRNDTAATPPHCHFDRGAVEKSHILMAQAAWWQEISRLRASIEQKALSSITTYSIARNDVEAGSRLSFGQFP